MNPKAADHRLREAAGLIGVEISKSRRLADQGRWWVASTGNTGRPVPTEPLAADELEAWLTSAAAHASWD
jgi:hypothetical protein